MRVGEIAVERTGRLRRFLPSMISLLVLGRSGVKHQTSDVNHPTFAGRRDFIRSFARVMRIYTRGTLDGKPVLRPSKDHDGWLDPAFREKLCLVVTINNHCVG